MSVFQKVVGTRCLGQVDPQCQNFVNKTQLPAHKRHCPTCGSTVSAVTASNNPVILGVSATVIIALGGGGFLAYQKLRSNFIDAGASVVENITVKPPKSVAEQTILRELEKLNQSGDFASVLKRGEEYLANNPLDAMVLNNVGTAALRLGKFDAARRYIGRAVDLKPNDGYFRYNIGCVEARVGNKDEAVNHLKKACQLGLAPANFRQDPDLASLAGYASFEDLVVSKSCK